MGWVLTRGSTVYPETFAMNKNECWSISYNLVSTLNADFRDRYWKQVYASKRAAKRYGFEMKRARVVVCKEAGES